MLSGRPNRDVLRALDVCDFVVDGLHSDTPMAGFAAEAAAHGRPAVVGGYGWDEVRRLTSPEVLPPSHLVHPDQLADAITTLAEDHSYREELGACARRFVEERWAARSVAERMLKVIEGSAPPEWTFDPGDPIHPYGAGITMEALRHSIRLVVDAVGPEGLHVSDKPELQRRLLALGEEASAE